MINITRSIETGRTGFQGLLNDLSTCWNWKKIVYDEDNPTNVKELWASDKVYLSLNDGKMNFMHSSGFSAEFYAPSSWEVYCIVQTDKGLLAYSDKGGDAYCFCIAKTVDLDGAESTGIVGAVGSNHVCSCFTDNMLKYTNITPNNRLVLTSSVQTQLIPVWSWVGKDHFNDVYFTFMSKSDGGSGETILNDEYYYMKSCFALAYTL